MNSTQIKPARQLLGFNQTELAKELGWTTKRHIINLESPTNPKLCTLQTALSIECLLRRANLWQRFVKTDWFSMLSYRSQDGLTRLQLFDIDEVQALVNDINYKFPSGCNLGDRSKAEIASHITIFKGNNGGDHD